MSWWQRSKLWPCWAQILTAFAVLIAVFSAFTVVRGDDTAVIRGLVDITSSTNSTSTLTPTITAPTSPAAPSHTTTPVDRSVIEAQLDHLVVAPPYTAQPYRRAMFGDDSIDIDNDCHNTRAEVLMQETTAPVTFNANG